MDGSTDEKDYDIKYLKQIDKYVWHNFWNVLESIGVKDRTVHLDDIIKLHEPQAIPAYRDAIENLKNPLSGTEIKNGKELYDAPGYYPLISEIIDAMEDISVLSEGQKKI